MTNSFLSVYIDNNSVESKPLQFVRWFIWKLAIATLILMAIGVATRVMNAGLACPDWPLCYGKIIPTQQMNLQVFLEWFHRLDAAIIGLSVITLVIISWWNKSVLPKWLPIAITFSLFLIIFQGLLGALTVTKLLEFEIVTAHLATALLLFATFIFIGCLLTPSQGIINVGNLKWLGITACILVYLQCLLGGIVASRWALHQCFNSNQLCQVMNNHIIGVFPATISTIILFILVWRSPTIALPLKKLANSAGILVMMQILVGISTFKFHLQVEILTITHHLLGAILFGILLAFSIFAWRHTSESEIRANIVVRD